MSDPRARATLWILDDAGEPVPAPDMRAWDLWFRGSAEARQVAYDEPREGLDVSTVFTGIDLAFARGEPPKLFETRAHYGRGRYWTLRSATRPEAMAAHRTAVDALGKLGAWWDRMRIDPSLRGEGPRPTT